MYTYTTHVLCKNCGHQLTHRRETAGEPEHYECKGCGAIFSMTGAPFGAVDKLRLPDPGRSS
ncbi:hypothetical protein LCGC14_2757500 [marine sediment metagenome]|uniref:Uncharacterized protein n=1 Tax=marine sediment metagenome TaxID=412755 RepID=A0A0F8Z016_9ZZZZ